MEMMKLEKTYVDKIIFIFLLYATMKYFLFDILKAGSVTLTRLNMINKNGKIRPNLHGCE